jgi:hypothetical protein
MSAGSNNQTSRFTVSHVALIAIFLLLAGITASQLPIHHSESPQFASPAFQRVWSNEAAAATRVIDLWGGDPLVSRVEPYFGAPNDRRVVQYFDRGRMEVEAGSGEVTQGKLALELTSGEIDLGGNLTLERQSPEIPIDSAEPDEGVPTWLTLSQIVGDSASDRSATSERIIEALSRTGTYEARSTPEVRRYAAYIDETGHNLPDVTVDLFERPEFQNERWLDSFGYPISEPYWTSYHRQDDLMPALVQVFERRVLIYTPGLDEARSFTTPSSGRHYAIWRYGSGPYIEAQETDEEFEPLDVMTGENIEARIHADEIGTPIDMALSATGHLMVLNAEGQILQAQSTDPDGHPEEFIQWADGIDDPQGLVVRGETVIVTAGNRVLFMHDEDGRGVPDAAGESFDAAASFQKRQFLGKPVRNSAGDIFARIASSRGDQELREIGSSEALVSLSQIVAEPRHVRFLNGDLLVSGRNDDDQPEIHVVPSVFRSATESDPQKIAAFSEESEVGDLAVVNEDHWSIGEFGDVLVAVREEDGSRLLALSRNHRLNGEDEIEIVELASGLSRPTAIQIGLDGSIYVAEADPGRIIRILHYP